MKHTKQIADLAGAWQLHHRKLAEEATVHLAGQDLSLLERCQVVGILLSCAHGHAPLGGDELDGELTMHSAELRCAIENLDGEILGVVALALASLPWPTESICGLWHAAVERRLPLGGIDDALTLALANRAKLHPPQAAH